MRIFIGRDVGIGDMVMCNQVVRAVRKKYPDARIAFGCGPPPMPDLLATNPAIDEILSFPDNNHPRPALRRAEDALRHYVAAHSNEYDKIFMLFPEFTFTLRCRERGIHLIEHYAEMAGVRLDEKKSFLALTDDDERAAAKLREKHGIKDGFIAINHKTFYTVGSKQWPLKYFQRLIDTIRECTNRQVVVVGSAADQDVAHAVYVKGEFIRAVAALLKHALLYIGLDSGITHIVSTFTVPIIAIHPSTFPEVTGALADDITFISGSEVNGQKHVVPFEAVFGEVERRLKG